ASDGGFDTVIEDTPGIMIVRREIEPGGGLARECHFRRTETWTVVSGRGKASIDGQTIPALPGSALMIPRGASHALANDGEEMLVIYEVRAGALLGRDDALSLPAEKSA
ncbi:MAG: cupin domain-containing protein, partial [Rhizobiaceae bacterium]